MSNTDTLPAPVLWLAWNSSYTGIRFWTADAAVAEAQTATGLTLTGFYSEEQMRAALAQPPAASGEPTPKRAGTPGSPSDPEICNERSAQACGPVYCGDSGAYCSACPKRVTPPAPLPVCKGMNCGATDGRSQSLDCHAEHAAAIAGGVFVPAASGEPVAFEARVIVGHAKHRGGWCVFEETEPGQFFAFKGPFPTKQEAEDAMRAAPQPAPAPAAIRAAFEAWASDQKLALNRHHHSYAATSTAWCWDAWQAAQPAPARVPLTQDQKGALWSIDHREDSRRAAFQWHAAGIDAAERHHGITAPQEPKP